MLTRPILMSRENPGGMKLEDLLRQVRMEIDGKSFALSDDPRAQAQAVLLNNLEISGLLLQAEATQRRTLLTLAELGPDQGPAGTPRVGRGSHPHLEEVKR